MPGQPFFRSALGALKGRRLNMDVPISLAILLATGMSLYQTMRGSQQVYFDAAVSLLFFLLVGRFLDERCACAPGARRRISLSLQSGMATVIEPDGAHRQVPAHALRPGDRLLVVGWREGSRRRRGAGRDATGRPKPDHRRDGAADGAPRGSRSMPARST